MHRPLIACSLALAAGWAAAQSTPAAAKADEQVVVPEVDRRDVRRPRFPSNDFEVGLFAGTYSTQNFGAKAVAGIRLGYHITEDFFVEGAYGRTKVSDELYRQILPGGIFPQPSQTLSYYNASVGYNLLPGEVFFGRNVAKASALYVIAGSGSTKIVDQSKQTINLGFGLRLLFNDHFAAQVDVRDHLFDLDLLGKRESTQNLEVTLGLTAYF